jgi:predicted AlkP superfamily pyrophosphatase or phosphodiesterase
VFRRGSVLGLALAALLAGAAPHGRAGEEPPAAPERSRSVLLVSWDGVGRGLLKEMLEADKLPNLAAMVKTGSVHDIEIKGHATETRPGHAEMLTGLGPASTKIRSNASPGPIPAGLPLFDRLKKHFGRDGIATAAVTGKRYVGTLFAASRADIDVLDAGARLAADTGPAALAALAAAGKHKSGRFFVFVHFSDPDAAGHGYGHASRRQREATVTCDAWLGRMVEQLKKAGLGGSTSVYVTADHGFDIGAHTHDNAPHVWLVSNDKSVKRGGTQADVPATVLARFGLDVGKLEPKLIGRPLTEAREPVPQKVR